MKAVAPYQPKVEKVSPWRIRLVALFRIILWALLIFSALHIVYFYFMSLIWNVPETTAVRYAVYIVIGSFLCLFVHDKQVFKKWGTRDVEPIEGCPLEKRNRKKK